MNACLLYTSHMAYFDEGTQAQREIAGVIAGAGKK